MIEKQLSVTMKYISFSLLLTCSSNVLSLERDLTDDGSSKASPWGDVRTKSCVEINGDVPNLKAEISAWVEDLRVERRGNIIHKNATVNIPAGSYERALFCTQPEMLGQIYNEGKVHYSWNILSGETSTSVNQFKTYASFDGSGPNNDWDINEQGHCSSVWLGFKGNTTCGWLENIPDEDYVTAYYAPDLSSLNPEVGKTNTYRVNLGMLMASFDGLRYTDGIFDIGDLLNKPIGEIIRRADQVAQQSELVGKISAHLPDGTEKVLLDTKGEYISVNFLETHLRSFTFSLPKNISVPEKITIECNVTEIDNGNNETICSGTKDYLLQEYSDQQTLKYNPESRSEDNVLVDFLVKVFNDLGYEKLYVNNDWGTIYNVIDKLLSYPAEFWNVSYLVAHPGELDALLKGVSGIYVMNANIEKLDNYSSVHSLSDIDWRFYTSGTKNATTELYGQLYYMPSALASDAEGFIYMATGSTIEGLLAIFGVGVDEKLLETIKSFPIPFYWGEAIPIFDVNRQYAADSGYQAAESSLFNTTISHAKLKNGKLGAYFVNMWDRDGEMAVEVDECLAKGNSFGLQNTTDGNLRLDHCNYTNESDQDDYVDVNISLNESENNTENEYVIEGELTFTTTDGAGGSFEAYGNISLQNNSHEFYNITLTPGQTAVFDGAKQHIKFSNTFKSNTTPVIVANVDIYESDSGGDDEIIVANQTLDVKLGVMQTISLGGGELTYKVSEAAPAN